MSRIRLTVFAVAVTVLVAMLVGIASESGLLLAQQRADGLPEVRTPEEWAQFLRIMQPAAKAGDAEAQFALGVMYDSGLGLPEDDIEALFWYRQAAEQGQLDAQFTLGTWYSVGNVVPQDHELAVRWLQAAAARYHAAAQNALANQHYTGRGVQQSYDMAAFWWRLAAARGDVDAMHNLGNSYYLARGVQKDDVLAYMWHAIAARESVGADRQEHIERYTEIAELGEMTPDEIAAAQKLASEWEPATVQR